MGGERGRNLDDGARDVVGLPVACGAEALHQCHEHPGLLLLVVVVLLPPVPLRAPRLRHRHRRPSLFFLDDCWGVGRCAWPNRGSGEERSEDTGWSLAEHCQGIYGGQWPPKYSTICHSHEKNFFFPKSTLLYFYFYLSSGLTTTRACHYFSFYHWRRFSISSSPMWRIRWKDQNAFRLTYKSLPSSLDPIELRRAKHMKKKGEKATKIKQDKGREGEK